MTPTMSPIASVKRPKKRTPVPTPIPSKADAGAASTPARTATPYRTPETSGRADRDAALSPMHGVRPVPRDSHTSTADDAVDARPDDAAGEVSFESKLTVELDDDDAEDGDSPGSSTSWVGRKVDAIFSPVLSFLQGSGDGDDEGEEGDVGDIRPHNLEEELGRSTQSSTHGEDSDNDGEGAITATVAKDLSENYDSIPAVNATESSASRSAAVDGDGDATMEDPSRLDNSHEADVDEREQTLYGEYDEHSPDGPASDEVGYAANHSVSEESYDDDEEEFNPYLFIKCLPPYHHAIPPGWQSRPKVLPPLDHHRRDGDRNSDICLVLDLDETLVHCTVEPVADADMVFPVEFNGTEYQVHVRCRPFLREFLEAVSRRFEVVIFTASQQVYADKLLDKIDPEGKFIRYRIFRDSCLPVEGNFLKDLTVLGRDLSRAVLVDNSPHAFGYQVDNGIPIESWFDDPSDRELLKLEAFLRTLHGADDVRDVVRRTFGVRRLVAGA